VACSGGSRRAWWPCRRGARAWVRSPPPTPARRPSLRGVVLARPVCLCATAGAAAGLGQLTRACVCGKLLSTWLGTPGWKTPLLDGWSGGAKKRRWRRWWWQRSGGSGCRGAPGHPGGGRQWCGPSTGKALHTIFSVMPRMPLNDRSSIVCPDTLVMMRPIRAPASIIHRTVKSNTGFISINSVVASN
jgi:hypothetical protein